MAPARRPLRALHAPHQERLSTARRRRGWTGTRTASGTAGPKVFFCEHPDWRGELYLFENGRVSRPGLDSGDFVLKDRRQLVLKWDRWPTLTLHWNEQDRAYRDPNPAVHPARRCLPEGPNGASGPKK